ncbi:MAG: hypothetical protein L3J28_15085 [Candidatus Polarisedimenticolaceae bacterium]|nr:hypothetical protein [Candidatus Polarisedimenticolaceae bacterium]
MNESFDCWKCGQPLGEMLSLPIGRNDSCPHCRAELCVCRLCHFYDPSIAEQCREPIAERVSNKERANFCGYFQLNRHAYISNSGEQTAAKSQLDALFSEADNASVTDDATSSANVQLDQLFK